MACNLFDFYNGLSEDEKGKNGIYQDDQNCLFLDPLRVMGRINAYSPQLFSDLQKVS